MTLTAGIHLGPWEILAPLGAGGMGEVYRAKDPRLARDVAIKVLPDEFFDDEERRLRFEREARTLASLNHPGIAAIYSFEEIPGSSSPAIGSRHILVMELVEGEDLSMRLASGPLPVDESLSFAKQIAEALEAAHEKGVVHRDLKPANIKVTPDGRVKLLDFGLAKIFEGEGAGGSAPTVTHSPTLTARATQAGVILGTAAYMSPEQARGKPLDKRTDIWAFGCVLFEMLTGKRAFEGETVSDTLAAVLMKEPDWGALPAHTPGKIRDLLRRCLSRDAKQRLHDIADARLELEELTAAGASSSFGSSFSSPFEEKTHGLNPAVASAERARRERGSKTVLYLSWAIAAAFAAAAVASLLYAKRLSRSGTPLPVRIRQLSFSGADGQAAVSPDGKLIAFSSSRDGAMRIWIKQLAGGGEAPLTVGRGVRPRFSPDGSSVLFVAREGAISSVFRVALVGGEARRVLADAYEADWSPDGQTIAFVRSRLEGNQRIAALGVADIKTAHEKLLLEAPNYNLYSPRWSPDGSRIAVARLSSTANAASHILVIDAASGKTLSTSPAGLYGSLSWSGSEDRLVATKAGSVMGDVSGILDAIVLVGAGGVRERPLLYVPHLFGFNGSPLSGTSVLDTAGPGRLVFDEIVATQSLREVALGSDPASRKGRVFTRGNSRDRQPAYSPDGAEIIFSSNRSGNLDLWSVSTKTGAMTQLTDDPAQDWDPAFLADGRHIVWSSDRSGHLEIWTANRDGSGARQISHDGFDAENPEPSSDGKWMVYWSSNPEKPGVWKMRPDGSEAVRISAGAYIQAETSPNGPYATYIANDQVGAYNFIRALNIETGETLRFEVPVPFDLEAGAPGINWGRVRWMPGGKAIAFVGQTENGASGIFVQDFTPGKDTTATRRVLLPSAPGTIIESFSISPDGRWLTASDLRYTQDLMLAEGVPEVSTPVRGTSASSGP